MRQQICPPCKSIHTPQVVQIYRVKYYSITVLQIRRGNRDKEGIIFNISTQKHIL